MGVLTTNSFAVPSATLASSPRRLGQFQVDPTLLLVGLGVLVMAFVLMEKEEAPKRQRKRKRVEDLRRQLREAEAM
ncbi:MAG: hypothetical protein L0212_03840 [Acidobacteria bacterium]|nr:hypothetical protein [Acidobacteriota bacterium]